MYSFIEIDEDYKVKERSSEEMISIISLQEQDNSSELLDDYNDISATSDSKPSLSQRLSRFANAPLPDWLLRKV